MSHAGSLLEICVGSKICTYTQKPFNRTLPYTLSHCIHTVNPQL